MKNVFIEGEKIYLRALNEDDIEGNYVNWFNDSEVCKFNAHHRFANTKEKTKAYINNVNSSNTSIVLAICTKDEDTHIGNVSIQNINYIDSSAEYAIVMGETGYHGKGIAFEASMLILKHAFDTLNLHRVYCGTSIENIPMQKLALKMGMSQEGHLKDALFKNGKYVDIILYSILSK